MNPEPLRLVYTYLEQDMSAAELHDLSMGTVAVLSVASPAGTRPNQDAAAVVPLSQDSALLVVADGAGGMRSGAEAAGIAVEAVANGVAAAVRAAQEARDAILNGIEAAQREVVSLSVGAATTLSVVEVRGDRVRPYHVGDSMIMLVGQRGKIKLQTVSHSPVGYAVEAGYLDEQEALHHEERHLVSNMIGLPGMHIEVGSEVRMAPRDTLVVASDGLSDNLHVDEIVERARKGPIVDVANRLATDSQTRMRSTDLAVPSKPDDLTLIVFRRAPAAHRGGRRTEAP